MLPAWLRGTLLLTLTLMGGFVIGIAYERSRTTDRVSHGSHHAMQHLTDELGLDAPQQRAIAAIFARRQRTVDSTWHELQPHVRLAMDSTLQEIVGVLRPDQVAKYRKMVETRHHGLAP
jgi:hypothetical protein